MKKSEDPITLQYEFNATPDRVWTALVEWQEMIQWFFNNIPDFRATPGFTTSFVVENEGRTFTHQWIIVKVDPKSSITYDWSYQEYPGKALLTFVISSTGANQTILTLTMETIEDFQDDIPEFQRSSCIGGWNYFIGEQLRKHLAEASI